MYDSRNSPTGNINDLVQFGGTCAPLPDAFVENKAFQAAPSAGGNTLSPRQTKIAFWCLATFAIGIFPLLFVLDKLHLL